MTRIVIGTLLLAGCAMTAPEPSVRFEVRGLETVSTESQYGTSFSARGTLVALGDEAATQRPYIVLLEYRYVGGGDPGATRESVSFGIVNVVAGTGDIRIGLGYRPDGESWVAEKYELLIVGYTPLTSVPAES